MKNALKKFLIGGKFKAADADKPLGLAKQGNAEISPMRNFFNHFIMQSPCQYEREAEKD